MEMGRWWQLTAQNITGYTPDVVRMDTLEAGDKIEHSMVMFLQNPFQGQIGNHPGHSELITYVASIGVGKTFKVYFDFSTRTSKEQVAQHGYKLSKFNSHIARSLFPMLEDYEFIS